MLQLLSLLLLFALMQGCSSKAPEPSTLKTYAENSETNPRLSKLVGKNYIKGIITALNHESNAQVWNYVIEGIDTTNGKLPYVNFNHKTVLANEGDLVYASFDGNRMTEMLVIKAGYFKGGKKQEFTPPPRKSASGEKASTKRDKAHQILAVPQEETVKF